MALGWTRPTSAFLRFTNAGPVGPQSSKAEQRTSLVRGEPDRRLVAVDGVVFRERRERDETSVVRSEPTLPMGTANVPNVRGATVGLEPEQFLEVDRLAFALELLRAFLRGVHQSPLR